MQRYRLGLIIAAIFLGVFAVSWLVLRVNGDRMLSASLDDAPARETSAAPSAPAPPPPPADTEFLPAPAEPAAQNAPRALPDDIASIEPGAGMPAPGAMPPAASADPPGAGVPMAPSSTALGSPLPPSYTSDGGGSASLPPAAHDPPPAAPVAMPPPAAPVAMPPAAANGHPPAAANGDAPVTKNGHGGNKVLSYFQHTKTQIDTRRAFGFVLLPKAAITADEKKVQKQFCEIMLATMDFMTPGAIAAVSAQKDILATYWPIVNARESFEIKAAFTDRNCANLIAWYDHKLARSLATKAGVAGLSGPLLITWPSSGVSEEDRNPLIVDFSKADHERATKVLQYWFRQLRNRPDLWTSRIREGTIRAELADAVNDSAGVVLAVLHGKWDSLTAVSATP